MDTAIEMTHIRQIRGGAPAVKHYIEQLAKSYEARAEAAKTVRSKERYAASAESAREALAIVIDTVDL